jgi:hypothetical protein
LNRLYTNKGTTPGSLELQLRCFAIKENIAQGHNWPVTSYLSINGFNLPITQRAPPGNANISKVLKEIPADLFPHSRAGRNAIELKANHDSMNHTIYALYVQIVRLESMNQLIENIQQISNEEMSLEKATQNVIQSFKDDEDDEIIAMSTILSVRCPLGLGIIDLPARGKKCKHLQCFDLKTFLTFNRNARSRPWTCTICHNVSLT